MDLSEEAIGTKAVQLTEAALAMGHDGLDKHILCLHIRTALQAGAAMVSEHYRTELDLLNAKRIQLENEAATARRNYSAISMTQEALKIEHKRQMDAAGQRVRELEEALKDMTARKDGAYRERNQLVAALAKLFPSIRTTTAIEGWSEDWHSCVYIELPTGQVSWHFHDSEAELFQHVKYTGHYPWDGHDTEEKYRRLAALNIRTGMSLDAAAYQNAANAARKELDELKMQLAAAHQSCDTMHDELRQWQKPTTTYPMRGVTISLYHDSIGTGLFGVEVSRALQELGANPILGRAEEFRTTAGMRVLVQPHEMRVTGEQAKTAAPDDKPETLWESAERQAKRFGEAIRRASWPEGDYAIYLREPLTFDLPYQLRATPVSGNETPKEERLRFYTAQLGPMFIIHNWSAGKCRVWEPTAADMDATDWHTVSNPARGAAETEDDHSTDALAYGSMDLSYGKTGKPVDTLAHATKAIGEAMLDTARTGTGAYIIKQSSVVADSSQLVGGQITIGSTPDDSTIQLDITRIPVLHTDIGTAAMASGSGSLGATLQTPDGSINGVLIHSKPQRYYHVAVDIDPESLKRELDSRPGQECFALLVRMGTLVKMFTAEQLTALMEKAEI